MRQEPLPRLFGRPVAGIHCLGIGGMGVGPLAIYLAQLGFTVTGEDDALGPEMQQLVEADGIRIGPLPERCDLVVRSSAVAATHPSVRAAVERNLPLVRRGELLAEAVRDRRLVAVCGSHGKTTTTAMLIGVLRHAGFPAGYVLGGLFGDGAAPARAGSSDWVVAEIDESDGTIGGFSPEIAVAVNLDWDHPDFYRAPDDLARAFAALFERTRGAILVSDGCALSQRLRAERPDGAAARVPLFSFGPTGEFSGAIASESAGAMRLRLGGKFGIGQAEVRALGEFNAANATAALAAAQLMGAAIAPGALAGFSGVRRRQSVLRDRGGITVVEDYAHHPAEIRALLGGLRRRLSADGRLVAVFQPHRFSRTAQFKSEFAAALGLSDRLHLLDVYGAGEQPIAGGTSADIYAELKRAAPALPVRYLPGNDELFLSALAHEVRPGDLVAFIGAGDIDRKARMWLERLEQEERKAQAWDAAAEALRPLLSAGAVLRREEPLARRTTLRVGGAARLYVEPANVEDLQALLKHPWYVLGRGSNLIVPDEGVDGVVISLAHPAWCGFEPLPDGRVRVGAGLRLKNLCGLATKAGLVGFEFLEGIPGSVGGALRMNAGAMGGWMFDVVDEVQLLDPVRGVATLRRSEMHVDYRHCAELHGAVALGAVLRPAAKADADAINRQMDTYRRKRQESQPREPSAGCIFKNPPGDSAGRLIDACGLKGERSGGAEVSTVHANFIVNRGAATAGDVLELVRRVRARVKEMKDVDLQPEVLLYGQEWKDVL